MERTHSPVPDKDMTIKTETAMFGKSFAYDLPPQSQKEKNTKITAALKNSENMPFCTE